jgi:hypothetical protein
METGTQMLETIPDPQVQQTFDRIMKNYVTPYRENGEAMGVREANEVLSRLAARARAARAAAELD